MKNIVALAVLVCAFVSCDNPYENVKEAKYYTGNPFVSLSSEQAVIRQGLDPDRNHTLQAGVFKDSLVLSHTLDHALTVTLELVDEATRGNVEEHFSFQETVTIQAGENYGNFTVSALEIPQEEVSKYKLSIHIKSVDDEQVIAGLYGAKKENEARKKRFKTYSFQK
ncbi:MAG: hypothetical protein JEZ14_08510 [Marinilabiliaceae bacterium]|nr:hypothetical protein [Marinilabiliaceae bacterium]